MRRPSFRRRRRLVGLLRVLRMLVLVLLACTVWAATIYACGRQAQLLGQDGGRALMRQILPGIW